MAKTESHIPKLRFAGFSDPWQKNKLKNIGKISIGGDVNQEAIQDLGKFPVIANGLGNDGIVGFYDNYKIAAPAITISGRGVGIGFTKARFQNFTPVVRLVVLQAPKFDAYFLENNISRLNFFIESTGVPQLTAPQFGQYEIHYSSVIEQTKIGDFFQKIDQVIELQQKALETARDYKKSMLQKMFPQKGEEVPKVRFEGFSGDWGIFKFLDTIEDIIDFRGRTPLKIGLDWSDDNNGYLALSALNVKQGYIDFDVDAHYGNNELYQKWMSGKELRKGQVLFTTEAPMGNVAQVPDNRGYILSQRTIAFITKKLIITDDFLACLLRSHQVVKELQSLASGGTATGVSQRSLSRLKIQIPKKIEEQQKIGVFFQKLDQQIEQHEKKLESYQSLKKAMLQRMFV